MSHHYGKAAEVAIPQANGIASVGFVTGTALIGTIASLYPNFWRLGLLLAFPVGLILVLVGREKNAEDHVPDESGPQSGKLSAKYWLAWVGFVACISSEFATSFWSAALLKDRVGSTAAISTVAIVALGTGMGVASIAAGYANPHLAHRFGRAKSQWIGLGIFLFGLFLFVISPPVFLTIPATLIAGFGTSMVINTMLSSMSHHYGKAAEVAIPQANGIASVGFVTGTALIGTIASLYPNFWLLGILLALFMGLILVIVGIEKNAEDKK